MFHIELIGVCANRLSPEQQDLLAGCVLVAHSRRQEPLLAGIAAERVAVTPLAALYPALEQGLSKGRVAVLASGDPLFFGIGRSLLAHFGPERLRIHPAVSAMQLACARFKIPWDDLSILSLHGRNGAASGTAAARLLCHQRVLCFTDQLNSPDSLAQSLIQTLERCGDSRRLDGIRIQVAENLGLPEERIISGSLAEIAATRFAPLNMMLLEQLETVDTFAATLPAFGLVEHEIRHSRGLITKDEIRAASLHRLRLPRQGILWDIGGGSGSVSLEAARIAPELAIYTVEKKPEEQENIRHNIKTFGAYSIQLIAGEAPEILAKLPAPDRVFIGGSGGGKRLEAILHTAAARLQPGGRIVVNAVLAETRATAVNTLSALDFQVTSSTLALVREQAGSAPQHFNPITIVTGSHEQQHAS